MTEGSDRQEVGRLGSQDLHVHTTMSDGAVPLREVVEVAARRGVQIGIADHVSTRFPDRFVATLPRLKEYLDAVGSQPVFIAAEFCWGDAFSSEIPPEMMRRFDYRLGSNHGFLLPDGSWGSPWWKQLPAPWNDRPHELMDSLVDNLVNLVTTMPIEVVAHSTFMPAALYDLENDVAAWWTDEREDRFVEAVVRSGVAMEISSRYRLPHDRLLRKALQAGARFSLGSDGHHADQIANIGWAVETAHRVGITEREMFVVG